MDGRPDSLAIAASTPLPGIAQDTDSLREPQPRYLDPESRTPSSIYKGDGSAPGDSSTALGAGKELGNSSDGAGSATEAGEERQRKKRPILLFALIGLAILVIVVLAVVLPVYFKVIKPKNDNSSSSSSSSSGDATHTGHTATPTETAAPTLPTTGGDGSTITTEDGTTFTYANTFGGICTSLSQSRCLVEARAKA